MPRSVDSLKNPVPLSRPTRVEAVVTVSTIGQLLIALGYVPTTHVSELPRNDASTVMSAVRATQTRQKRMWVCNDRDGKPSLLVFDPDFYAQPDVAEQMKKIKAKLDAL